MLVYGLEYQYIAFLKNRQNYKTAAILKIFNVMDRLILTENPERSAKIT